MEEYARTAAPEGISLKRVFVCDGPSIQILHAGTLPTVQDFRLSANLSTYSTELQKRADVKIDKDYSMNDTFISATSEITTTKMGIIQSNSIAQEQEVPNIILYSIVLFLAVLGNALVIITLLANFRMRTVTSCFLLSLSVSDLLLAIICMPISLTGRILKRFVFGTVMCKVMPLFMGASVSVSTFTMLAISLERYYAICRPLKSLTWQTVSHAYKIIIAIWCVSIFINLPYFILSDLHYIPLIDFNKCSLACRLIFPSPLARQAWYVFLLVTLFCIPGAVMTVAYILVSRKIWRQFRVKLKSNKDEEISQRDDEFDTSDGLYVSPKKKQLSKRIRTSMRKLIHPLESETNSENKSNQSKPIRYNVCSTEKNKKQSTNEPGTFRRKRLKGRGDSRCSDHGERLKAKKRVVRMLIVIVILFFVCWTPLFIVNVWKAFDPETAMEKLDGIIEIIQLMSYVSTCVNPVVYCFMNQRFRSGFLKAFLYCCPGRLRKTVCKVRNRSRDNNVK